MKRIISTIITIASIVAATARAELTSRQFAQLEDWAESRGYSYQRTKTIAGTNCFVFGNDQGFAPVPMSSDTVDEAINAFIGSVATVVQMEDIAARNRYREQVRAEFELTLPNQTPTKKNLLAIAVAVAVAITAIPARAERAVIYGVLTIISNQFVVKTSVPLETEIDGEKISSSKIQLAGYGPEEVPALRALVGKRVQMDGEIFAAHTRYHIEPLLIDIADGDYMEREWQLPPPTHSNR